MKSRLLLDCDGVLSDFVGSTLAVIADVTGRQYQPEQITDWSFAKALGLSDSEWKSVARIISNRIGFCEELAVYPGAVEGVSRLREVAEVFIVTSPWNSNPTWMYERERWLKKHFDIPHSHVIHCSAKHLVCGEYLVDDKTETLIRWQDENAGLPILWEAPYNRNDGWKGISTKDWGRLYEAVLA